MEENNPFKTRKNTCWVLTRIILYILWLYQWFGSWFIESGSGSSILGWKISFILFLQKIAIYSSLGLHKGRPSYRRSPQPSKENIPHGSWFGSESTDLSEYIPSGSKTLIFIIILDKNLFGKKYELINWPENRVLFIFFTLANSIFLCTVPVRATGICGVPANVLLCVPLSICLVWLK